MVCRTAPFSVTLNDPKPGISRSGQSLTLNIFKMVKDTAIVTIEGEWEIVLKLSNGTSLNDLE